MRRLRHSRAVRALAIASVAGLAWTAIAAAAGDNYKMRMLSSGKAAARAVMLTQSDVGAGWTGGPVKPDLSVGARCANYKPRLSDLVLNGAAKATYKQPGFQLTSAAQVLKTADMVRLDWRRSIASPHFIGCMRRTAVRAAKHFKAKVVSLRPLAVPRIGDYSGGYRMVIDYTTKNGKIRMVIDTVGFAKGRTEMSLTTTMPIASVPTLVPNEAVLARLMAGRVRA